VPRTVLSGPFYGAVCQVSEKWKIGPVIAQTTIEAHASAKVVARLHCCGVHCAAVPKAAATEKGWVLEPSSGGATLIAFYCIALRLSIIPAGKPRGRGAAL
jgi:hypothetical protein